MAQRIQNRLELRMILMNLSELKMITPGQYKSMGTGGLKNEEIRALMHTLQSFPERQHLHDAQAQRPATPTPKPPRRARLTAAAPSGSRVAAAAARGHARQEDRIAAAHQ